MPLAPHTGELTNVPSIPFTPNPHQFDSSTQRNHHVQIPQLADPGNGKMTPTVPLAQAGIASGLWIQWTATVTTVKGTGTVTPTNLWPYGVLADLTFAANLQAAVHHVTGRDLHVMRFLSNPALPLVSVDSFPGAIGGGVAIADGAYAVSLTWFLPIAADQSSLAGALYLQSALNLVTLQMRREDVANLFTLTGTATAAITNPNFAVAVDFFDIPRDPHSGSVVTPDLSHVHGLNYFDFPFTAPGQIKVPLQTVNGNLLRLAVAVTSPGVDMSPRPADASGLTGVTLHYGANKNPQQWDMNSLVSKNAQQYGGMLPFKYFVLDFLRENPVRDAVVMPGLTDLAILVDIAAGTTIPAGSNVHVLQQTLYRGEG